MAGALVGGAFLSGFLNVVFDRLLSIEALNLIRGKKLDQELLDMLKLALRAADALVDDAEKKQFHDTRVKEWLDDLKDAVYEADDLLDHVYTKVATQNKEVSNFLPRFLNDFKDREMVTDMVTKMQEIIRKIEALEKCKDTLGLKEILPKEKLSWRTPSTSLVKGEIYGREEEKEGMIKLFKDENTEAKISVIPIVGMGGVGKTTLAQWLYNNEDLMKEFDLKAWVCVSKDFNIVKITQTIIEGVTRGNCDKKDSNLLQLDLKDKLVGKKFFIVLDDVWNDDYDYWRNLEKPFQYGNKGSKILVTTRSIKVASVVQTCPPHLLNELSEEHCWSVFANHACFPESNGNPTLERIGRNIVKKCKGLPLAAQTLGSLLRVKQDVNEWNNVLTSEIWEFSVKDSKIIPALLISYYDLPPHLKRCFVYCSLFRKDYEFVKDELILLWMAEDLLPPPQRGKTLEEVGYACFEDLSSRLFFKQSSTSDKFFVMHDLMHDLATSIGGEFYFSSKELGDVDEMSTRTRHLSYERSSHPISKTFDAIGRVKSLRSFWSDYLYFSTPLFIIGSILSQLKFLRVLSFKGYFEEMPDSIGELIHLRYLDLSSSKIKTLPESLCNLYNLQTLKLRYCFMLKLLPKGMQNLVNLRHLDIYKTNLVEMPPGMSKLKKLQHLDCFAVGKHEEENGIMELGELSNIHGSLSIRKLENVGCSNEALKARMMDKTHIERLEFEWSTSGDMVTSISSEVERNILDKLQPHKGLQELIIKGYRGTIFPDWVGHSSYHNMTSISLKSCSNCCMLPSFGQLASLEYLEITGFDGLVMIDDKPESNAFLKLKTLAIFGCPMLKGNLPHHLPALENLKIFDCPLLRGHLPVMPHSVQSVSIDNCSCAISFPGGCIPVSMKQLSISNCSRVEFPRQELPALENLEIFDCPLLRGHLPLMPHSVQSVFIDNCSCAISFPGDCIPVSVKQLSISNCSRVEFPRQEQQHELLESLSIKNSCDSLTSFPLDNFPKLELLWLKECENLESLSMSQPQEYAALYRIVIEGCPNLVSFPEKGLAAPSMSYFIVKKCQKLKSFPRRMNTLLPKLAYLTICDCPEIELFPDEGLPPNLKSLEINNCKKLFSGLSSMGVLEGLTCLSIGSRCESVKSFPKQGSLPHLPSITRLKLTNFSSLETLDCKELLHLTSLQQLSIAECPKLENLTGERLPASLKLLHISYSPLLGERCKMKDPQIWPKISHIRDIGVVFNSIQGHQND